ncbi:ribosomal protein S18-alanine N-acetyltransferase [uncultured Cohaesibacter sp.]|uniref:ribosomal protein S18-alanine N-acetyltransferase n=1 Tax=uncultured Cohaesibacter sp. TaxID=1002546 RepID=UPI0029C658A2|nr:ribosomal protein S18-alanine N-acetyltransferase [uncultured Cohaesibacter sp.]
MIFALKTTSLVAQASTEDISVLTDIHAQCFARGWSASEFQSLLADKLVDCLVLRRSSFLATDQIAGFVLARSVTDEAEILTIAVDPDHQNSGCGRQLMEGLMRKLYGDRVAKLFLEVDASNEPALSLYRGLGFEKVGERKGYYTSANDTPSLALIMQVNLSRKPIKRTPL